MHCMTRRHQPRAFTAVAMRVGFVPFAGFLSTVCCLAADQRCVGVRPRLVLFLMSYPCGIMPPIEKTGTKNLSENPSQAGSLRHEIGFPDRF